MGKKILAILLVLCMAISLAACGGKGEEAGEVKELNWTPSTELAADAPAGETDDRAFKKFENPVEVHIGTTVNPTDTTLPEGDSAANNMYTRYLEETFNIKTVIDWEVGNSSDFNQKVSLQIASGTLPDSCVFTSRTYLVKAARAGLCADMYEVFDGYASKQVKEIIETTKGRAYDNATVDGVYCSIPNISVDTDGVHIVFLRQDWLDDLGLEVPKTVADIEAVAEAFLASGKSGNYAIAGIDQGGRTYTTFLSSSNNGYGFDPVYESMGAYPGYWLKDDAGEIYYGTNTPEMKSALEVLARWYKDGLINPELGVTTGGANADEVKNGTCGIWFGPWWGLGYGNGDSFKNDPTADWQAFPVYTESGEWNVKMKDCGTSYTYINKNASQEVKEAVVVMNNSLVRDESILITRDDSPAIDFFPLRNVMAAADECEYEYNALYQVLKGEKTPEDFNVPGSLYKNLYQDACDLYDVISKDYDPNTQLNVTDMDVFTNNGMFNRYYAIFVGDRPYATIPTNAKIYSELYSTTDAMEQYWTTLQDLEDQTVLSIITGKADISTFDTYIEQWNTQGGDKVIESVKEMVG